MSRPPFPGFSDEAFAFLRSLAENNDRDWFKARKGDYERELKTPLQLLVGDGARRLSEAGLSLSGHPTASPFRIHRDMRFTDDKTPYKTNVGAVFDRSGQRDENGVVYVHVESGNCFLAAGFYQPSVSYLRPIRTRIVEQPDRFFALLETMADRGLPVESMKDTLTGMPKGFSDSRGDPVAPYLKWKHYVVRRNFADEALQTPDFVDEVVRIAHETQPLFKFIWEVEPSS